MAAKDVLCEDTKRNSEMKCPNCGYEQTRRYDYYGTTLEKFKYCPNCGHALTKANETNLESSRALTPKTSEEICEMVAKEFNVDKDKVELDWFMQCGCDLLIKIRYKGGWHEKLIARIQPNGNLLFVVSLSLDLAYEIIKFFKYSKEVVR